jgi:hypothetical protein
VRATIAQAFDPACLDCHFDRCGSNGLELEGVDCYLWRLEEEADGLYEAVELLLEVADCPETQHCDLERGL